MRIDTPQHHSTATKIRRASLQRSLTLLRDGISDNLSGAEKRLAEADLKIASFRKKHGLLPREYRQITDKKYPLYFKSSN